MEYAGKVNSLRYVAKAVGAVRRSPTLRLD